MKRVPRALFGDIAILWEPAGARNWNPIFIEREVPVAGWKESHAAVYQMQRFPLVNSAGICYNHTHRLA